MVFWGKQAYHIILYGLTTILFTENPKAIIMRLMKKLGVNVDHIATLREQRKEGNPSLVDATKLAIDSGADIITIHLREDRRHIQDADLWDLIKFVPVLNLEMAATEEMIGIAIDAKPTMVCLVPEKREELTTEGGLDLISHRELIGDATKRLQAEGIQVSLFIDAEDEVVDAAKAIGADIIELHTGSYARARVGSPEQDTELARIQTATQRGVVAGLQVNAGHGLRQDNVGRIAGISDVSDLHIGHSLVADALFVGLGDAIRQMKALI